MREDDFLIELGQSNTSDFVLQLWNYVTRCISESALSSLR